MEFSLLSFSSHLLWYIQKLLISVYLVCILMKMFITSQSFLVNSLRFLSKGSYYFQIIFCLIFLLFVFVSLLFLPFLFLALTSSSILNKNEKCIQHDFIPYFKINTFSFNLKLFKIPLPVPWAEGFILRLLFGWFSATVPLSRLGSI